MGFPAVIWNSFFTTAETWDTGNVTDCPLRSCCGFYFLLKVLRLLWGGTQQNPNPIGKNGAKHVVGSDYFSLLSLAWLHLQYHTWFPTSTSTSPGQEKLTNGAQQGSAMRVRGLECTAHKERLRESPWRKEGKREKSNCKSSTPKRSVIKRWRQIFLKNVQWKDNGHKLQSGKFWWDIRKKFFLVRMIKNQNRFPKRLKHFCPLRFSKLNWIRSWPTSSTFEMIKSQKTKEKTWIYK